jgi:hypothetical protein
MALCGFIERGHTNAVTDRTGLQSLFTTNNKENERLCEISFRVSAPFCVSLSFGW